MSETFGVGRLIDSFRGRSASSKILLSSKLLSKLDVSSEEDNTYP
jgi:hypothetical protein